MSEFHKLLAVAAFSSSPSLAGPALDEAEVRLPYGELKALIAGANHEVVEPKPEPALLAARFRILMIDGKPVIDTGFRTTTFADGLAKVPLVGGNVAMESQLPLEARVLIHQGMLCQALETAGVHDLEMRLLAEFGAEGTELVVPPCPTPILETAELGEDRSVSVKIGGHEQVLGSNQRMGLPISGCTLSIRILGGEETREALKPPTPSTWTWQHQALVIPGDGEIGFRVLGSASAPDGSGVSATLGLPSDAREVKVTGDDLIAQKLVRSADRSLELNIEWKTRGVLEREVAISYSLPLRPLDLTWKLQSPAAPGEDSTRTRFIVVSSPGLSYAADGLAGPFSPKGLPGKFSGDLDGSFCYQLEAGTTADLSVSPLPVVATAEATVTSAMWLVRVEPDGAMLTEGEMTLEHRGLLGLALDVPAGMTLLSCEVEGRPVPPVNLGEGRIEVGLPTSGQKTRVTCSFTGRTDAIDPVEGILELALPKTPLFIRALVWKIDLPRDYQAETHGNLVRGTEPGDPPSRMTLRKNLCRDERPQTNVFYQRSGTGN